MKKIIYFIAIFIISFFIIDAIYTQVSKDKTPGKAKRLECQKKVTSFERGFDNEEILQAQNQVEIEDIVFTSYFEKAIYTKSKLFENISLEETNNFFEKSLKNYRQQNINSDKQQKKNYKFKYYIYENDMNDPNKKNKKSKLYAGYSVFEVKTQNNKTIYKVQIDFMSQERFDIYKSLDCTIESFMTYNR